MRRHMAVKPRDVPAATLRKASFAEKGFKSCRAAARMPVSIVSQSQPMASKTGKRVQSPRQPHEHISDFRQHQTRCRKAESAKYTKMPKMLSFRV
jgi:hypothetical protein